MGEKEYDAAWLDEMLQRESVADFARVFSEPEADYVEVLLKVACQPEDVLRVLDDEERLTRIAFEDTLTATGLIKRAKVAFCYLEEEETGIRVWLVPSGPWEDFAYWQEDGARKRNGVVVALARALGEAFGVDTDSHSLASQLETMGEMLSLAHDFPFLLSAPNFATIDWCEIAVIDGRDVFEDIMRRCNCILEACRRGDGYSDWHSLVNLPLSGYLQGPKPFFCDERTLADYYRQLEEDLAAFRSSPRGGKAYVVIFSVVALRPSFAFILDKGQADRVSALEQALVGVGFCQSASVSVETLFGEAMAKRCAVCAVVYAEDREVARDLPFAFHKDIVGIFQQTCGCLVVKLRIDEISDVSPLFPTGEDF